MGDVYRWDMARSGITAGQPGALRRRERRRRLVLAAGAVAVLAALIAALELRSDGRSEPVSKRPAAAAGVEQRTGAETPLRKGGTLRPDARKVAERFLLTALGRTSLDEAWTLASPGLRRAVTRRQWLAGELPVPPFPVGELETTGFHVVESSATKILLQILLVPRASTGFTPMRYDMTLVRARGSAAPWRVSYLLPYAPPGMVKAGE